MCAATTTFRGRFTNDLRRQHNPAPPRTWQAHQLEVCLCHRRPSQGEPCVSDPLFYVWDGEALKMLLIALGIMAFILFGFACLGLLACVAIMYEGMERRRRGA